MKTTTPHLYTPTLCFKAPLWTHQLLVEADVNGVVGIVSVEISGFLASSDISVSFQGFLRI
jgi:hypothetical protein